MKKAGWRRLAQRFAYPKKWPKCFAFWIPNSDEQIPSRVGLSYNGISAWYRLESDPSVQQERQDDA